MAQFSGLTLTAATYGDRLQLTSGGLSATTNTITVDAGQPSHWVIVTQPPATVSPRQNIVIVAAVEDVYGNVVYTENGTASLSLAEAPTGGKLQDRPRYRSAPAWPSSTNRCRTRPALTR